MTNDDVRRRLINLGPNQVLNQKDTDAIRIALHLFGVARTKVGAPGSPDAGACFLPQALDDLVPDADSGISPVHLKDRLNEWGRLVELAADRQRELEQAQATVASLMTQLGEANELKASLQEQLTAAETDLDRIDNELTASTDLILQLQAKLAAQPQDVACLKAANKAHLQLIERLWVQNQQLINALTQPSAA